MGFRRLARPCSRPDWKRGRACDGAGNASGVDVGFEGLGIDWGAMMDSSRPPHREIATVPFPDIDAGSSVSGHIVKVETEA